MKYNIEFLGEEFENEISECKQEEDLVRELYDQYNKSLIELKNNNNKRIEVINRIRLSKIKEIDEEVKQSTIEFKKLYNEGQKILNEYCQKNGHKDILIASEYNGSNGNYLFRFGKSTIRQNRYKCEICGRLKDITSEIHDTSEIKEYKQIIPNEIYDDATLNKNGKSLKEIIEEIEKINEYINYLEMLKRNLCILFGHDVKKISVFSEDFKCDCCGHIISSQEYIDTYRKSKYRGIIPFYYHTYQEQDYIISSKENLTTSLPTYKDFQKTRKK